MSERSDALVLPVGATMRRPTLVGAPALPLLATPLEVRRAHVSEDGALATLLGHAFEAEHWDAAGTERELFGDETVRATLVVAAAEQVVATASLQVRPDVSEFVAPGYPRRHWMAQWPLSLEAQTGCAGSNARPIVRSGDGWRLLPSGEWFGTNPYNGQIDASGRLWFVNAPRGIRSTHDSTTWGQINLPAPLFGGPLWSDGAGTLWLSTLGKVPAGSPLWDAGSWKRTDSVQLRRNKRNRALDVSASERWRAFHNDQAHLPGPLESLNLWQTVKRPRSGAAPCSACLYAKPRISATCRNRVPSYAHFLP